MSAPISRLFSASHSFRIFTRCAQCNSARRVPQFEAARCFSSSPVVASGHSKWATIKHDKGKADAAKSKQRANLTKDVTNAVKLGGPDPNLNPRLALAIATAKKSAVPKANIEAALARGQGLSASGAALDSVVLEVMLPPSVAVVIECQTDNKLRLLSDLRLLVKEAGGNVSTVGYMFEKKGRITLQQKENVGVDEVLEPALDAGVLDVEEDQEGRVVLYTEPTQTKTIAETLAKSLEMEIEDSEIIYDPNEDTKVSLDDAAVAKDLGDFLDKLQEVSGLQGVYINWAKGAIEEEQWADLQSKVTV